MIIIVDITTYFPNLLRGHGHFNMHFFISVLSLGVARMVCKQNGAKMKLFG